MAGSTPIYKAQEGNVQGTKKTRGVHWYYSGNAEHKKGVLQEKMRPRTQKEEQVSSEGSTKEGAPPTSPPIF